MASAPKSLLWIALAAFLVLLPWSPPAPFARNHGGSSQSQSQSPLWAEATSLTVPIAAHDNACFFAMAPKKGAKLSFYFAVQKGGNFDIDFIVSDPEYNVLISGDKERQGDYVFAASAPGEYSFCFHNGMSSFVDKVMDLDISVEGEDANRAKIPIPAPKDPLKADTRDADDAVYRIRAQLSDYERAQRSYRVRGSRNFDTVLSTQSRVFWLSLMDSGMILLMSLAQVYAVKSFFKSSGRGRI